MIAFGNHEPVAALQPRRQCIEQRAMAVHRRHELTD
jgi:hypothetical protein